MSNLLPVIPDRAGELLALAERCERGTGADRELDAAIAMAALGYTHDGQPEPYRRWIRADVDGGRSSGSASVMIREFTASLDAALGEDEPGLPDATPMTLKFGPCTVMMKLADLRRVRTVLRARTLTKEPT